MAEDESRAKEPGFLPQYDAPTIWRLLRWGLVACAAVTVAFLVGTSEMGMRRIAMAYSGQPATPPQPLQMPDNGETARLNEQVRKLTLDRERLLARLEAIERNVSDLTGSIALSFTPPRPANVPPPPENAPVSMPVNPSANAPPSTPPSAASNAPANAASAPAASPDRDTPTPDTSAATKIEFGIDLGSAPTVEALRTLWINAKNRHGSVLESLRPIVTIREGNKPGSIELRLVAGPLPSAALAQRMCLAITITGAVCQPAVFDGQRLAMR